MSSLYHFGVKGMHWGVRRYQNEDGSYNSAGKKRYKINPSKPTAEAKKEYKQNLKNNTFSNSRGINKQKSKMKMYGLNPNNTKQRLDVGMYGYKGAVRIQNRMKYKQMTSSQAHKREFGRQMVNSLGVGAVTYSAVMMANPLTRKYAIRQTVKAMRTGVKTGQKVRGFTKRRYNKAVQLPNPKRRYVKAKYTVKRGVM